MFSFRLQCEELNFLLAFVPPSIINLDFLGLKCQGLREDKFEEFCCSVAKSERTSNV